MLLLSIAVINCVFTVKTQSPRSLRDCGLCARTAPARCSAEILGTTSSTSASGSIPMQAALLVRAWAARRVWAAAPRQCTEEPPIDATVAEGY